VMCGKIVIPHHELGDMGLEGSVFTYVYFLVVLSLSKTHASNWLTPL